MPNRTYKSHSLQETHRIAASLLDEHPGSLVIALSGDLGSGKTAFVQGLALALGCRRPVTSPTFTLLNEYPTSPALLHADLYRIEKPEEADGLGLEDYMESQAIVAVEWPEKAPHIFPSETVRVYIKMGKQENERQLVIETPR